jgi:hypothetical protein
MFPVTELSGGSRRTNMVISAKLRRGSGNDDDDALLGKSSSSKWGMPSLSAAVFRVRPNPKTSLRSIYAAVVDYQRFLPIGTKHRMITMPNTEVDGYGIVIVYLNSMNPIVVHSGCV